MSNKPQGRKRHMVSGNVEEIKKQEEALDIGRVGESSNFISKFFRRVIRGKDDNEKE